MTQMTWPSATLYLALVLTAGWRALAVNDWSVPCTGGECSWDLPADSGASGSIHIWGPSTAISDITTASGWRITSCDPISTTQDIQLVCEDDNLDCGHIFQGGPVNTIVRLPDSCGPMPFARVGQHGFLQPNVSSRNNRFNGAQIHVMSLDTNYTTITPPQNGGVHFSLWGVNMKGAPDVASLVRRRHWRTQSQDGPHVNINRRNFLAHELNALKDSLSSLFSKSLKSQPIHFTGSTNLLNMSIQCPTNANPPIDPSASVFLDAGANVNATVGLFAVVGGTFPKISKFDLLFALDGTIDANLSVRANASGQVSSDDITLFEAGIPGLTFPGILEIGPEFKVIGRIDASLKASDIEASVNLKYDLSDVKFHFPPQANSKSGAFKRGTSHVTASTNPDVGLTFEATGHLIPQIDVALKAFDKFSSSIFVNLDASTDVIIATSTAHDAQACLSAITTLDVGVGAQASFFDIFDASVRDSLFKETFPLVHNKCFGPPHSTSAALAARLSHNGPGTPMLPPLTNTAAHRRDAPRAPHAPPGRSVVPAQPRAGVVLQCPLVPPLPPNVTVAISLSIP